MIAGGLLLILVAVALLGTGLARGNDAVLVGSIAASLLAAIALVIGARQDAAAPADDPARFDNDVRSRGDDTDSLEIMALVGTPARDDTAEPPVDRPPADRRRAPAAASVPTDDRDAVPVTPPTQRAGAPAEAAGTPVTSAVVPMVEVPPEPGEPDELADQDADAPLAGPVEPEEFEDPPDEPPPQRVPAADAARVARLSIDVLVVDGRPRYHLAGCQHLHHRETEPLPVSEAVELGFTPCSLCEPDTALLAYRH